MIDTSKVDALLEELDRIAQSFNREKLGLPIPGANDELRAAVVRWVRGEIDAPPPEPEPDEALAAYERQEPPK